MKTLLWIGILVVVALFLYTRLAGKVPSAEARQLVAAGAALVDVRSPGEFGAGHIEGAINIPVDQIAARHAEIGAKDRPVVVYCASGMRSASAASTLKSLGFTTVADVGGMANY